MSQWYFARNGQQRGPYSLATIQKAVQDGKLGAGDLVWNEEMTEWLPLGEVEQFAASLAAAPQRSAGVPSAGTEAPRPQAATPSAPAPQRIQPATQPAPVAAAAPATFAPAPQASPDAPAVAYQSAQAGAVMCTPDALRSLRETKPWTRFIAILLFVGGGFFALGGLGFGFIIMMASTGSRGRNAEPSSLMFMAVKIVLLYAVIATVYIVLGVYLNRYASGIARLLQGGGEPALERALAANRSFWRMLGIMVIVGMVLSVLLVAYGAITAGLGGRSPF